VVTFMEVAELVAAQCGASALRAVDLDVLTSIWKRKHVETPTPSPLIYCNHGVGGIFRLDPRAATSCGQNLEPQRVSATGIMFVVSYAASI